MQKKAAIYTRYKMGIDYRVWLTLLITALLSVGLLGFKLATTVPCYPVELHLKGVVEHQFAHNYYVGEGIIFHASMKTGKTVEWDFGDGTPPVTGNKVTHSYKNEGNFLVTATINGKCRESVNVHISQVVMTASALPATGAVPIAGKDILQAGELSLYQCTAPAASYEWTVENDNTFSPKTGSQASFSFTDPGNYIIRLKLDNDETKVFRKTVMVAAGGAAATSADELPPLPLPAPPVENSRGSDNNSAPAGTTTADAPAIAEKKVEIIPDPIFKNHLQDVIDGKGTMEDVAKYLCDGMNTKVKGNGKIYSNLSLFGEELKGKKGMLGLGGKRKIKAVKANRDAGNGCVFRLDVEYK
jgi:hypothetical protein